MLIKEEEKREREREKEKKNPQIESIGICFSVEARRGEGEGGTKWKEIWIDWLDAGGADPQFDLLLFDLHPTLPASAR